MTQADLENRVELRRRVGGSLWVQVDAQDIERVSQYRWHSIVDGRTTYALRHLIVAGRKTTQSMHVFIMDQPGIDHIDGNGLNNKRANLRVASHRQNGHNRASNIGSSSQYKGVSWHRPLDCWRAAIKIDGKDKHLGYFDDETVAASAYDDAARKHFGVYARPNFQEV